MVIDNDSDIVAEKKNITRKFWEFLTRNKLSIGVISSLIASLIFYFAIKYNKEIWGIVRSVVEWFWGLITYRVALPIWSLLLVLALFAILIVGYIKQNNKGSNKESLSTDSVLNVSLNKYTEDSFFDAIWRWRWGNHGPEFLNPYCPDPNCDTLLVCRKYESISIVEYELFCDTCGYKTDLKPGDLYDLKNKVLRQIDRKIRQKIKEYKDNVVDKG